jgi:hypothetical protein
VLSGVEPTLLQFAVALGRVHLALFGHPLIITSGKDGTHVNGSLHAEGRALDVRIVDLVEKDQILFLGVLASQCVEWECRVFDERVGPGGQHVHIEFHG